MYLLQSLAPRWRVFCDSHWLPSGLYDRRSVGDDHQLQVSTKGRLRDVGALFKGLEDQSSQPSRASVRSDFW